MMLQSIPFYYIKYLFQAATKIKLILINSIFLEGNVLKIVSIIIYKNITLFIWVIM